MKKFIPILILIISLLLAFITRFYMLGEAPAGLYLDEAGQGYNAYSILLTGRDEFGKSFPIVFRSFTDFKTPVYTYMIVPLIPIFGLTKFAVRFPSFALSLMTLPIIYILIKKITPKKHALPIASLTTLLLAISPWHIVFGRTAFECNIALFFFIAGVYFFYKGLEKPKFLIISSLLLAVSLVAYHAYRVIVPVMGLTLFIRHRKTLLLKNQLRFSLIGAFLAFLIFLPTLSIINTKGFMVRAAGLNIFSIERQTSSGRIAEVSGLLEPIINNRIYLATKEFVSLYVTYFSPRSLFSLGDYDLRSSFPELATFFAWQMPFYLFGFYKLVIDRKLKELRFFTLAFLFIAPLPAAMTRDPYSSIRSLQMVIPLLIIISLGMIESWMLFKKRSIKTFALTALILIFIYSVGKLYSSAIILNEHYRASAWNYGWQEVTEFIKEKDSQTQFVVDTARQGPYIELAFFLKYNPVKFQTDNFEVTPDEYYIKMDRRSTWNLSNVTVKPIEWGLDLGKKQFLIGDILAISDEQIKNHNLTLIKDILYPDREIAFRIVETNPD